MAGGATDHLDAPSRRFILAQLRVERAATVIVPIGRGRRYRDALCKATRA
jgi:hypothetical protein